VRVRLFHVELFLEKSKTNTIVVVMGFKKR